MSVITFPVVIQAQGWICTIISMLPWSCLFGHVYYSQPLTWICFCLRNFIAIDLSIYLNVKPIVFLSGLQFLAHETAQTHRKSSSRSFDPERRSSTGYSCAPSKSKQSNAALIVSIVLLRRWSWRHNTNAIFPATSKLRLVVIAVALHSWTSYDKHTTWSGYEKHSQVTHLHLIL